jgi:O-antigen ligase
LQLLFSLFFVALLLAPRYFWREGVFTLWPLATFKLAGRTFQPGALVLLPPALALGWFLARLLRAEQRPWSWGRPAITLPLLALTGLMLARINLADSIYFFHALIQLGLLWFVYLFLVNERPGLLLPLGTVCAVQAIVALGQFLKQDSVGLAFLGEQAGNPQVPGVIVLSSGGHHWLRGYGLAGHPNVAAAIFALTLLLLLPLLPCLSGRRQKYVLLVFGLGFAGLLVTFSRGGWLAFAAGSFVWLWLEARSRRSSTKRLLGGVSRQMLPVAAVLLAVAIPFFLLNAELIASRFLDLDTTVEAPSIDERARAAAVALQLFARHPWSGVGSGNFAVAGHKIAPYVRTVHVAPLRAAAELGLAGLAAWLWLAAAPFLVRDGTSSRWRLPAWVGALVLSLFHASFWPISGLHTIALYGLLLANAGRPVLPRHNY